MLQKTNIICINNYAKTGVFKNRFILDHHQQIVNKKIRKRNKTENS